MADGLNDARAVRVAELINDYRTLQLHISQQRMEVPAQEQSEEGFVVMRECINAAQRLLSSQYNLASIQNGGDPEAQKVQLQRVILDGSVRRFQAHKIYLRIAAARRWAINRANVLRGERPSERHAAQLRRVNDILRQELTSITDQHVASDLRAADVRAGHWLDDDPSLATIMDYIRSHS
ncbi:conserved hypothetical protein [Paecilomyces variotii No. 5]|uniref:Uncharacterized protein n=1 Tax=Byssochlamys spectabilis (strain No. 5 / NBRC 109023) TaxID=1356009 RepID=V5I547_BYSSN|nr:conserved hypothetical protein [Paecilomyces variotii No. 5]